LVSISHINYPLGSNLEESKDPDPLGVIIELYVGVKLVLAEDEAIALPEGADPIVE
tara:strand:+ start:857 stop:1024 length:168 start_codon:yes stop_codon:yes gene_type:complete